MDKPIPEAVLDRLAHEAYQVHCDTPTRAFPNDTHWPKWRAVVQHVADALTAAQQRQGRAVACTCPSGDGSLRWPCPSHPPMQQGGGEVVAWMTPGGDVSRSFCWCLERCLPGQEPQPLYTAPPSAPVGVEGWTAAHGLLARFVDELNVRGTMMTIDHARLRALDAEARKIITGSAALAQQPAAVDGARSGSSIMDGAVSFVEALAAQPGGKP